MIERLYISAKVFKEQLKTAQSDLSYYNSHKVPAILVFDQEERKPYELRYRILNPPLFSILKKSVFFGPIEEYEPLPELNESSLVIVPDDFEGTFKNEGRNNNFVEKTWEQAYWDTAWENWKTDFYLSLCPLPLYRKIGETKFNRSAKIK